MKQMKQPKLILILIMFVLSGSQVFSQEPDTAVRYNQYGVKVNRTHLEAEERNGTLVLESKDQKYKIWYDARVQVDGAMFFGDTYNPIGNGMSIRRARFAVKSAFAEKWYAEFDMDISNSQLELKDAYLEFSPNKNLSLRVGNFKEGYSVESTTTSRYLTFIERANAVNAFAPSRHIGFAAMYNKNWLFGMGGIHFQTIGDLEERVFSEDNNKDYGYDEGVSFTGKLVAMPFYSDPNKGLHFGVSGSYRTPKSDAEIRGTERYSVRSLTSINRKKYMDTDMMPGVDHIVLGGIELAGYHKNFRFQGEYLLSNVSRKNDLPEEQFNGWYAFGSVLLFGGKYNYNTSEAEFTQPTRGKTWGDVELAFRYDYLNLNSRNDGLIMGGAGEGYTFGINYHVNNNVKIMLNYAYLNHDRYANGKDKLYVGHDSAGELTKDPEKVVESAGEAGEDYSMISIRFEVDF